MLGLVRVLVLVLVLVLGWARSSAGALLLGLLRALRRALLAVLSKLLQGLLRRWCLRHIMAGHRWLGDGGDAGGRPGIAALAGGRSVRERGEGGLITKAAYAALGRLTGL